MISPGQLVRFYHRGKGCGWHVGKVVEIVVRVQPVAMRKKRVLDVYENQNLVWPKK